MMRRDPLKNEIELTFRPAEFISGRACVSLASGFEEAAAKIEGLTGTDPS